MARPASIILFERFYLGCWLVGLAVVAIAWNDQVAALAANPQVAALGMGAIQGMLIGGIALSSLVTLLLWYFAARRQAVVAKWIIVVLYGFGLIGLPAIFLQLARGDLNGLLNIVVYALHTAAIVMLFRRDARHWFGETRPDPIVSTPDKPYP
ncbi:hypothetical protein [uncultured Sphingomonas sp.]|uniref:hypothetical protein n=1 Tax=uncultured Sphingomonas sp. TaxID=158754 RepID=UPI0035C9FF70